MNKQNLKPGDKIRFLKYHDHHYASREDEGKIGIYLGCDGTHACIFLPDSNNNTRQSMNMRNKPITWRCTYREIEKVNLPGYQMCFDFMKE